MEFHVRSARLTDVEPAVRILLDDGARKGGQEDADRLRSLLFLPAATVVVAEAEHRVIGVGVLSIRPSVRGGPFIGSLEELGVHAPVGGADQDDGQAFRDQVARSMLEQLLTSARNKGCTRVDVTDPLATATAPLLEAAGFAERGALLSRALG